LPNEKSGISMKFTVFPHVALMILSLMGNTLRLLSTNAYSCSGPKTWSGLYVVFCLFFSILIVCCLYKA